jgi:RNA polymerase sigma-70 factor (ECF subfamily)
MAEKEKTFRALMARVLTGSPEAAQELFQDYGPFLIREIRRNMSQKIRSQFDSIDFAQDVWASFFAECPDKRVFTSAQELIRFLTSLAHHKVVDAHRQRFGCRKQNLDREAHSLDDSTQEFTRENVAGNQPTPSEIVMTQEEWTEFLRKQPLVYQRIFILIREGNTREEVAQAMGISERMVYRVMSRLTAAQEASVNPQGSDQPKGP